MGKVSCIRAITQVFVSIVPSGLEVALSADQLMQVNPGQVFSAYA
jgi:hypothetical protein